MLHIICLLSFQVRAIDSVDKEEICDVPINQKKKIVRFLVDHTCPTKPHSPPLIHSSLYSLAGSLTSFVFFLFFHFLSTQHKHFSHTPSSSPTVPTPNQHLHHHFSGKITGIFLGTHEHLHIRFLR